MKKGRPGKREQRRKDGAPNPSVSEAFPRWEAVNRSGGQSGGQTPGQSRGQGPGHAVADLRRARRSAEDHAGERQQAGAPAPLASCSGQRWQGESVGAGEALVRRDSPPELRTSLRSVQDPPPSPPDKLIKALEAHVETLKAQLAAAEARIGKQADDLIAYDTAYASGLTAERAKVEAERAKADQAPAAAESQTEKQASDFAAREAQQAASLAAEQAKTEKAIAAFASLADRLDALAAERARPWWRRLAGSRRKRAAGQAAGRARRGVEPNAAPCSTTGSPGSPRRWPPCPSTMPLIVVFMPDGHSDFAAADIGAGRAAAG